MSAEQLVGAFVAVWVVAVVVWIALDRLAHAGDGPFRPLREARPPWWASRRAKRLWRERRDAELRAALRAGRGRSTLRLRWDESRELAVAAHDTPLLSRTEVVGDTSPVPPPAARRPAPVLGVGGDPEPLLGDWHPDSDDSPTPDEPPETPEPASSSAPTPVPTPGGRWRRGLDPRLPSPDGVPPTPATVRSRFWKNLATEPGWDPENRARLDKGRPPRRRHGDGDELARLDLDAPDGVLRPHWPSEPDAPFGAPASAADEA